MKVEIVKGTAFELDPDKKYVIFIDPDYLTREDMANMGKILRDEGIKTLTVGVSPEAVKIVEAK